MTASIRIVQLYPNTLGITGDRGNARTLVQRLQRADIAAEHLVLGAGDEIPSDTDILILGNGPLSAMRGVLDDIRGKADRIRGILADGGGLFCVGGSAELLGAEVALVDGERIPGIDVLPYRVERTRQRRVGYILADSALGRIIGFEDHASLWHLDDPSMALSQVVDGHGSFDTGVQKAEGVRHGNAFASNVQGPALPLNPAWAKDILVQATQRRGIAFEPDAGSARLDELAHSARTTIERMLHERGFNAIQV